MHPEGSGASRIRVRLHRLTAVPALLICYAVVLNIGPFAKARQSVPGFSERSIASMVVDRAQTKDDARPDFAPPSTDASVGAQLTTPMPDPPAHDGAIAPTDALMVPAQPATLAVQEIHAVATPAEAQIREPSAEQAVAGIWAPNGACSLRDLRDGWLPAIIDADGARAGDTFCTFRSQTQTATGWRVVADCSDAHEHWRAVVRLTVKDDRLIWASARGRQVYTRCAPDSLMTAAR